MIQSALPTSAPTPSTTDAGGVSSDTAMSVEASKAAAQKRIAYKLSQENEAADLQQKSQLGSRFNQIS